MYITIPEEKHEDDKNTDVMSYSETFLFSRARVEIFVSKKRDLFM